ncbi:MAG: flavin reductase family protein [bacterium]
MSVTEDEFKSFMGRFATGVTVVTTEKNGETRGMTISDFASVSLSPPLVVISVETEARTHEFLKRGVGFTVNVLNDEQLSTCMQFAKPGLSNEKRFAGVNFSKTQYGGPSIDDSLAWFECEQTTSHPEGDHTLFIGEVQNGQINEGQPLLYYEGMFGEFEPFDSQ